MDRNLATYNQYVHEYSDYSLYPPERAIVQHLKDRWSQIRMLDIGVGTGRSSYTFAAIAGTYVGIDYAAEMLHRCQAVVPESQGVNFYHCDARDLSRFYDQPFDFALFSLNGIDSVGHEDREKILQEVRKILKPDGYFFFSTHSVTNFSVTRSLPKIDGELIRSTYYRWKTRRFNRRMKQLYRGIQEAEIRKRDWTILKTGDHDFKIDIYHIQPAYQLRELERLGFDVESVLDPNGKRVDPTHSDSAWFYFLCRPATV